MTSYHTLTHTYLKHEWCGSRREVDTLAHVGLRIILCHVALHDNSFGCSLFSNQQNSLRKHIRSYLGKVLCETKLRMLRQCKLSTKLEFVIAGIAERRTKMILMSFILCLLCLNNDDKIMINIVNGVWWLCVEQNNCCFWLNKNSLTERSFSVGILIWICETLKIESI